MDDLVDRSGRPAQPCLNPADNPLAEVGTDAGLDVCEHAGRDVALVCEVRAVGDSEIESRSANCGAPRRRQSPNSSFYIAVQPIPFEVSVVSLRDCSHRAANSFLMAEETVMSPASHAA